ncbi:hypothetical protein P3102_22290 [Amycolatopsis sp. QT-25]|nr:hypothetical protein [Amycolatopsis sp. QT-25]WET76836.1 hypothetical protein P3102_22290 [Amycolatopsis sp. QT-25]
MIESVAAVIIGLTLGRLVAAAALAGIGGATNKAVARWWCPSRGPRGPS